MLSRIARIAHASAPPALALALLAATANSARAQAQQAYGNELVDYGLNIPQWLSVGDWKSRDDGGAGSLRVLFVRSGVIRARFTGPDGRTFDTLLTPESNQIALAGQWTHGGVVHIFSVLLNPFSHGLEVQLVDVERATPEVRAEFAKFVGNGMFAKPTQSKNGWIETYLGAWHSREDVFVIDQDLRAQNFTYTSFLRHDRKLRRVVSVQLQYDSDFNNFTAHGLWQSLGDTRQGGVFTWRPSADKKSMDATFWLNGVAEKRTYYRDPEKARSNPAQEQEPVPQPEPEPQQPQPEPQPEPQPDPEPQQPAPAESGFVSLRNYDVRLDAIVDARDAVRHDVFLTLRNATAGPLYPASGVLTVRFEDSDGVVKQNAQLLRPTSDGRVQFASTPVLDPGAELKVKFSFHPDSGTTPARVTVVEGDKRAEFSPR